MAEGRRREDEEEELRERRELGGPRRARGRALSGHSAAGEGRWEREGARGSGARRSCPGRRRRLPHPPGWGRHLLRGETRGECSGFFSSSSLSGRARGNSDRSLPARGPRIRNYRCFVRTNAGAPDLGPSDYLSLDESEAGKEFSRSGSLGGRHPSRWGCLRGGYLVESRVIVKAGFLSPGL